MSAETIARQHKMIIERDAQILDLEIDLKNANREIARLKAGQPSGIAAVDRDLAAIRRGGPPTLFGAARMAAAMKLPSATPSIPEVLDQTFRKIRAPFAIALLLAASLFS
ncbi:MAG: hypothetical protein ACKV2Q_27335 [Planctomycetaceae bacterium]